VWLSCLSLVVENHPDDIAFQQVSSIPSEHQIRFERIHHGVAIMGALRLR
jgi:hypothetical protein